MGAVGKVALIDSGTVRSMTVRIAPVALAVGLGAMLPGRAPEAVFLALAVAVGLPHGAFDHKVGFRVFGADYAARWWQPFLAGYLTLAGLMLLLWWAMPILALSIFLLLSIVHFGDQDAADLAPHRIVPIVAHGGVPIIVSAACHPAAIERLLAVLVPGYAQTATMLLGGPFALVWVVIAGATLAAYAARMRAGDRTAALDLLLVTLLFVLTPPLIAFSLYFALIHAPRAFAAIATTQEVRAGEMLLPLVLTILALGLGTVIYGAGTEGAVADNLVRSAFLLLSALTVPHMWLEWRAQRAPCGIPAPLLNT